MTEQRYSKKESLNRILRALEGVAATADSPDTLTGDVLSENQAMSNLAELLEGSLPGQILAGSNQSVPAYGGVFCWTGTAVGSLSLTANTWNLLTGTFQNNMLYYSDVITPQYNRDRILINDQGAVYEVSWSMSFNGSPDVDYWVEPYCGGLGMPQAAGRSVGASGTASTRSCSGSGYAYASGTAVVVGLYVNPTATAWIILRTVQMTVQRVQKRNTT